mgnify:CR=1 FL=1
MTFNLLKMPVVYAGLRIATAWVSPIPGAVVIDPFPILLALHKSKPEKAGWTAFFYLPGLILGDLLAGIGLWTLLARALVACILIGFPTQRGFHFNSWRWSFHFSLATGILVDITGYYPLGFITLVGTVQGFLWWGILAPKAGGGTLRPLLPLLASPINLLLLHLLLPSPALWPVPVLGDHSFPWLQAGAFLVLIEPLLWKLPKLRIKKQPVPQPETFLEP